MKYDCALDICNAALKILGGKPIGGIDPYGNFVQRLFYRNYHPCRRDLLCQYSDKWTFAQEEKIINEENGYRPPNYALKIISIDGEKASGYFSWLKNPSESLYQPSSSHVLKYIVDEEDTLKFSDEFADLFVLKLAERVCIPFLGSSKMAIELSNEIKERTKNY